MEWSILFVGPVGAGKSEAVRTLSDIDVIETEALATDDTALMKVHTTVAMDMGLIQLDGRDKVRLYGAPGQKRFDFMWDILLELSKGVVVLIDHSRSDPVADLAHYLGAIDDRLGGRSCPVVIGVTHVDQQPERSLDIYRDYLRSDPRWSAKGLFPVLEVDARQRHDVRTLMIALVSMLEMKDRFPARATA